MSEWRDSRATFSSIQMLSDANPKALEHSFTAYANDGYKGNGTVFSLISKRAMSLKGIKFAYETLERPYRLTPGPDILRTPWPGGTTAQLIARMETDGSLAGNSYWRRVGDRLVWLRPDWVEVVTAIPKEGQLGFAKAEVLMGYVYYPGGKFTGGDPIVLLPEDVGHYKPVPDPFHQFFGQSWIMAVALEADSDTLMVKHKRKFFTNAAVPALAVVTEGTLGDTQRLELKKQFALRHESWENAYKTIYLEGGATLKVVGADMKAISFKEIQGAGETRLASAAGVPPIVVGFAEGMLSGTFSNYSQAMRSFADGTLRPLWEEMAETFTHLVPIPAGQRLWYDDRKVALLQQDAADDASIMKDNALTLQALTSAGYTPESAKEAVVAGSFEDLDHTGLLSVQLMPPGEDGSDAARVTILKGSPIVQTLVALMKENVDG